MNTWITSDTHFGHANIMDYCPWRRTWASSVEEHDHKLIEAWNAVVQPEDTVYHLGDFALVPRPRLVELRAQLKGSIILVRGNHDRSTTAMLASGFEEVAKSLFITCMSQKVWLATITLRHDPADFTPREAVAMDLLLHGHWHGDDHREKVTSLPEGARGKLVDVGIDARRDIAPALLHDVVATVMCRGPLRC